MCCGLESKEGVEMVHKGELMLIVHRKLFEADNTRYFVGEVEDYQDGLVRLEGYSWIKDPLQASGFERKEDRRSKIFSLSSGTVICYVIGHPGDPRKLAIYSDSDSNTYLAEDGHNIMDLSEKHIHATNRI
jgi:hypothetical protein